MNGQLAKGKYVPHKLLKDGSIFISASDAGVVIEIKTSVMKVMRLINEHNEPALNMDGTPAYAVQTNNAIIVLTEQEWVVKKQMMEREE